MSEYLTTADIEAAFTKPSAEWGYPEVDLYSEVVARTFGQPADSPEWALRDYMTDILHKQIREEADTYVRENMGACNEQTAVTGPSYWVLSHLAVRWATGDRLH